MDTKISLFIILSFLIGACSSNERKTDHDKLRGELEYMDKHIYMESGSFKLEPDGAAVIEIAGDGIAIRMRTAAYVSDTGYELSDEGNELLLFDGNKFKKITDGHISYSYAFNENTTGSFYFKYKNAEGKEERAKGAFYKVPRSNEIKKEPETFVKNKFMFVDVEKGAVTTEETECKIGFNNEKFVVLIPDFEQYNMEEALKQADVTASSVILHPADNSKIKLITIDKMNNNQITVLMKNGNSFVFL